jgi:hypothetical protein
MSSLNLEYLPDYRRRLFHTDPHDRITTLEQAVDLINARGLLAFWPLKDIPMPSLWYAAAGDRPVPDYHDDPGHVTWGWKDGLLGQRKCFYARILCKRTFFASLPVFPYLYALSNNYGSYEEDHLILYDEGKLTYSARLIYEALLDNGPLDTIELHRATHMTGKSGEADFNRALDELQMDYKVLPVGISDVGRWHYAMIFDIVARHFPEVVPQAGAITEPDARAFLVMNYLTSVGAARRSHLAKLFRWEKPALDRTLQRLTGEERITGDLMDPNSNTTDWFAIPELVLK